MSEMKTCMFFIYLTSYFDSNIYDFQKRMKVIASLSVSAPTNLTVCGNFTFLMAMWSERWDASVCGGHSCGMYVWQARLDPVWSIDSVPGGSSRPHICIVGFIRCLEAREELIWQHVPSLWLAELQCRRQALHQWETRTGEAWRGVRRMVRGAWQSF